MALIPFQIFMWSQLFKYSTRYLNGDSPPQCSQLPVPQALTASKANLLRNVFVDAVYALGGRCHGFGPWNPEHRVPASYQEGDWVLVHHNRLLAWPRSTSDDPYFGPYKILTVDGHRITVRCSPRLGGTLVCVAQQLKHYYDPEDLCGEEWELNDEEIAALDLQGAASPMEVEGELPDMNAEEMAKEGFYMVKSILRHRYRQGW